MANLSWNLLFTSFTYSLLTLSASAAVATTTKKKIRVIHASLPATKGDLRREERAQKMYGNKC